MSNNETGLMKKTKKELVEIILRKDDEEIRLKSSYEAAKEDAKKSEESVKLLTDNLNKANANVQQHQRGMDELTSQKVEAENAAKHLRNQRNTARTIAWILVVATVVLTIITIF